MTIFDDLFAVSAAPTLQSEFGEPLTYRPRGTSGGSDRAITAVRVVRHPPDKVNEVGEMVQPLMQVEVLNDPTSGISSIEIDTGGDLIHVTARKGATDAVNGPAWRRIERLLSDHAGVTRFEVR